MYQVPTVSVLVELCCLVYTALTIHSIVMESIPTSLKMRCVSQRVALRVKPSANAHIAVYYKGKDPWRSARKS